MHVKNIILEILRKLLQLVMLYEQNNLNETIQRPDENDTSVNPHIPFISSLLVTQTGYIMVSTTDKN